MSKLRPLAATIISSIWIVLGSVWTLLALAVGAGSVVGLVHLSPGRYRTMEILSHGWMFFAFLAVVLALGAIGLASGIGLLKLRAWALRCLVFSNWATAAFIGCFGL